MSDPSSSPKSVFITGAANAVAKEVARRLLAAGYRVTGAVATPEEAQDLRRIGVLPAYPDPFREGEVRSAIQGGEATTVIHLAPQAPNHAPHLDGQWERYERLLREGTPVLARAAEAAGAQFLILVSYAFLGGETHGHDEHDEEEPPFMAAAREAEQAVLHGAVPACVLRAGFVYGPSAPETLALRDALKGVVPIPTGDSHAVANWIHIDDLARAIVLAVERRPAGAVLNIVDNHPASPAAFIRYLADSMSLMVPSGRGFLARLRRPGGMQAALLSLAAPASNREAAEVLGWTPQYPSYREGIDQTLLVLRAEEPVL